MFSCGEILQQVVISMSKNWFTQDIVSNSCNQ